jgi:hypothetical protein
VNKVLVKLEQTGRNMIFSTTEKKNKKEILFIAAISDHPWTIYNSRVGRRFSL